MKIIVFGASGKTGSLFVDEGLTNGAKTDNLKHGCGMTKIKGSLSISRSNVAAFLFNQED